MDHGLAPDYLVFDKMLPDPKVLADIRDKNDNHICGGIVIHPQLVLLAYGCIKNYLKEENYGGIYLLIEGDRRDILHWNYPDYRFNDKYTDCALIIVSHPTSIFVLN